MPESRHDIIPAVEAFRVEQGLRLWWLGGPSFVVKSPTITLYVDPYHSGDRAGHPRGFERVIPNYLLPEDVTHADLVICTHFHSDHCDPATLEPLCRQTKARIAAAPGAAAKMRPWDYTTGRVDVFAAGTSRAYGDVVLHSYPARDWEDPDAMAFVLSHDGRAVFAGGDTLFFEQMADIGRERAIDLAVLALGKNRRDIIDADLYLDPPGIAQAALVLGAKCVLPVHWDIWKAWKEDPLLILPHLSGTGTQCLVLAPGESIAL